MEKPGRTFVSQSISFPPALLAEAKERCAKLGLSFSAYVQKCIERDVAERGAIVYTEREDIPLEIGATTPVRSARRPVLRMARRKP